MVGLGISRQGSVASVNGNGNGDVFGGLSSKLDGKGLDATLDEVDRFLQDEEEGDTFDLKHGDRHARSSKFEFNMPRRNDSSHSSLQSHRSHASDPLLEVLDNDDEWEDEDEGDGMEVFDGDEEEEFDVGPSRRSRRGRRRWNEDEGNGEAGLLEVSLRYHWLSRGRADGIAYTSSDTGAPTCGLPITSLSTIRLSTGWSGILHSSVIDPSRFVGLRTDRHSLSLMVFSLPDHTIALT